MNSIFYKKLLPHINDDDFFWQRRFLLFLIRENTLSNFLENLKFRNIPLKRHGYDPENIKAKGKIDYIGHAFLWSATPEGNGYWGEMNRKWVNLIRNL